MTALESLFSKIPPAKHQTPPNFMVGVEMVGGNITVVVAHEERAWQVHCQHIVSCELHTPAYPMHVEYASGRDHPLLRQFFSPHVDLFYTGKPERPSQVIGDLWLAHAREAGPWIPFDRYLTNQRSLDKSVGHGFGKVASGPRYLLEAYAEVLRTHGMDTSFADERPFSLGLVYPTGSPREEALIFDVGHVAATEINVDELPRSSTGLRRQRWRNI